MPACVFCQKEIFLKEKPGRCDVCPSCHRDLHCCYQCRFYDTNAHHECREPQADWVSEKDKANFCDYFVFEPKTKVKTQNAENLQKKWENLFKKP